MAFDWSTKGYLNFFFRQGDLVYLLDWFAILTFFIALNDHLTALSTLV